MRTSSGGRQVHGHHAIRLCLNQYYYTAYPARVSRHTVCHPSPSYIPTCPNLHSVAFPAQHTSAPGLITLTPITFFFTPLMSSTAKITIAFSDLRGVKKSGLL